MKPDTPARDTGKIDVAYVAHLARIKLSDEELRTFQEQLTQIVDYVNELKKVDISAVESLAHTGQAPFGKDSGSGEENVLRQDIERPGLPRARVLANAPAHDNEQFLVPKII